MLKGNNSFIGILATTSVVKGNKGNYTHEWLTYYTKFDCQNLTWTKIWLLFMNFNCFFWNFQLFRTFHCCSGKKNPWVKSEVWYVIRIELLCDLSLVWTESRSFYNSSFWEYAWSQLELLCSYSFIWTGSVCSLKLTLSENS